MLGSQSQWFPGPNGFENWEVEANGPSVVGEGGVQNVHTERWKVHCTEKEKNGTRKDMCGCFLLYPAGRNPRASYASELELLGVGGGEAVRPSNGWPLVDAARDGEERGIGGVVMDDAEPNKILCRMSAEGSQGPRVGSWTGNKIRRRRGKGIQSRKNLLAG